MIDTMSLRRYAVATVIGLAIATASMTVSANVIMLCVAIFLLRLFGQGLMTHIAVTSMAREFDAARGRAVAVASMGVPAGAALYPFLGALAVTTVGWRFGWFICTLLCVFVLLPLAVWLLLRAHDRKVSAATVPLPVLRFLMQKDILLALPALAVMGFSSTAIAFHQVVIAEEKGWPLALFASGFAVLGATSAVATLAAGWLVDRFGARRPALALQLPMAAACFFLAFSDAEVAIFIHMALMGTSAGAYAPVITSLLAEAYGVERIGAIRATASAVAVLSTSLSPLLFGVLVDAGIGVSALVASLGVLALIATVMLALSGLVRRNAP